MLKAPQQNVRERRASHNHSALLYLLEEISAEKIATELEVSLITVKRWISGEARVPKAALIAIEAILGRLPGMQTKSWSGVWINRDGTLGFNGLKGTYDVHKVYQLEDAVKYLEGALKHSNETTAELRAKLALATQGAVAPAANDGDLSVDLPAAAAAKNYAVRFREASQQFWQADREYRQQNYRRRYGWGR